LARTSVNHLESTSNGIWKTFPYVGNVICTFFSKTTY